MSVYPSLDKQAGESAMYETHSNVVTLQPPSYDPKLPGEWRNGLFECFNDCGECLCAYFCTPCYAVQVFDRAGESCCSCCWGGLVPLRTKVRTQKNIPGQIYHDYCAFVWCPFCALVQIGNELK